MKKTIIVLSVFVLFFFALFGVLEIPKYHQGSEMLWFVGGISLVTVASANLITLTLFIS
jgi:hypothetical protein